MTPLQIAVEAKAEEFVGSIPVQTLLTDIWHGKINPHVSSFRILLCMFFWPFVFFFKLFGYDYERVVAERVEKVVVSKKKNQVDVKKEPTIMKKRNNANLPDQFYTTALPFRVEGNENIALRIFYFLNAPIIKYVHHYLMHMLMLMIFCYLILFDLYPLPTTLLDPSQFNATLFGAKLVLVQMPTSEIFMLIYMGTITIGELREVLLAFFHFIIEIIFFKIFFCRFFILKLTEEINLYEFFSNLSIILPKTFGMC